FPKILINEIQLASASSTRDEFVELYNPNDSSVDLTDWYLQKKTVSGSSFSTFAPAALFASKTIPARGYFLIAHPSSTFAADIFTSYGVADNNTLALKNPNGEIVDKIGWGEAHDCENGCSLNPEVNQSIQRKFQNDTFIDNGNNANDFEIQDCPSPKTRLGNCPASTPNTAPSAVFTVSPPLPLVNQTVTFDASSSTDAQGAIVLYSWDFGDGQNTSSTQATSTHSYLASGNYTVRLVVFDNNNSSSTISSILSVASSTEPVAPSGAHVLISEVMAGASGADAGDEFIELYNPTDAAVDLSGWSLQYASGASIVTASTVAKKNFLATSSIPANGFFLVARGRDALGGDGYRGSVVPDMSHRTFSLSGAAAGGKIFLVNDKEAIGGADDENVVDALDYSFLVPAGGQSLERKAKEGDSCVSVQGNGEFLGNGCAATSTDAFAVRAVPNPQNTQSFPEPRAAPAAPTALNASSSIASYSSSSLMMDFAWQPSADFSGATSSVHYELSDVTTASSTLLSTTTSTAHSYRVGEVGRSYTYALNAFDRDGLGSATSSAAVAVPGFLDSLYFYRDPRASSTSYLVDFYYSAYPFVPQIWSGVSAASTGNTWRMVVLYLNHEAPLEEYLNIGERLALDPALTWWMATVKFKNCAGTPDARDTFLVFPDASSTCQSAGSLSGDISSTILEDNHVIFTLASSTADAAFASSTDYLTAAFYDFWPYNVPRTFRLVAVDRIRYYFRDTPPSHAAPVMNASTTVDFDEPSSHIVVRWDAAADSDTLDSTLTYEINFTPVASSTVLDETRWESASPQPRAQFNGSAPISYNYPRTVAPGDAFVIGVRAKDEFGNL
ncbi:hypothetical protein COX26_00655, partial [Candidatus Jorgensenbacteria bacterium CG23_combo_of_CG06-09_8_20_14_all_54_14]